MGHGQRKRQPVTNGLCQQKNHGEAWLRPVTSFVEVPSDDG
jgi:hypothetical protein